MSNEISEIFAQHIMEYNIYVYRHNLGVHKSSHPVSVGNVTLNLFVFKAGLAYSIK